MANRAVGEAAGLMQGGGWGRKTVKMLSEEFQVDVEQALGRLKASGIEAKPDSNLRELSQQAGKTPLAIAEIIRGREE